MRKTEYELVWGCPPAEPDFDARLASVRSSPLFNVRSHEQSVEYNETAIGQIEQFVEAWADSEAPEDRRGEWAFMRRFWESQLDSMLDVRKRLRTIAFDVTPLGGNHYFVFRTLDSGVREMAQVEFPVPNGYPLEEGVDPRPYVINMALVSGMWTSPEVA